MDMKGICLFFVILAVALIDSTEGKPPSKCQCKIAARERRNCGPPGISAADCRKAGCCFNASVPGIPWCFTAKPKKVKKVCPADPRIRVNCGYPGITAKECLSRRCCFRAHPAGVPWCFYRRTVEEGC